MFWFCRGTIIIWQNQSPDLTALPVHESFYNSRRHSFIFNCPLLPLPLKCTLPWCHVLRQNSGLQSELESSTQSLKVDSVWSGFRSTLRSLHCCHLSNLQKFLCVWQIHAPFTWSKRARRKSHSCQTPNAFVDVFSPRLISSLFLVTRRPFPYTLMCGEPGQWKVWPGMVSFVKNKYLSSDCQSRQYSQNCPRDDEFTSTLFFL